MLKHFRSGSKRIRTLWWILTIGTVVTFIGGFIFIFGSGAGDASRALTTPSVVGTVGKADISQAELASATQNALAQYKAQYGSDPTGRDAAMLQEQVWNNLLTEKAVEAEARKLGITVTDPEVVFAVKNTPPPEVAQNPAFLTNGRFDPNKWTQALADPSINWSPLEERMRHMLPGQRLEERVIAGVKISEPELRRLYDLQYQKAVVTAALLPLDQSPIDSTKLNRAALQAYYDAHKGDFTGPEQAQVELVSVSRTVGASEDANAKSVATQLVTEARQPGADFGKLARERSEGPYAAQGGDLGQDVPMSRLPPQLQAALAALPIGGVTDPIKDGPTYFVFKLNERKVVNGEPAVRMAQIQVPIHPSQESIDKDRDLILKMRKEAATGKLAEAAAKRQLVSINTGWFGAGEYVPMLIQMPQIQRWGIAAKKGEVSRAFATEGGWILAQVTDHRPAGPRPFESALEDVRRELQLSLQQAKPMQAADRIYAATRAGQTLEAAAAANGAVVFTTQPFARTSPDPRLAAAPRAVGLAFGLAPGQVGPPVASTNGVLVVRKDAEQPGSAAQFDSLRASLSQTMLSTRQRRFVTAWVQQTLERQKVADKRPEIEELSQ
jgi:peptidyl-prolyl cis-trans isomerase D